MLSDDGESMKLAGGSISGFFTLIPDTLESPFDRGLPGQGLSRQELAVLVEEIDFTALVNHQLLWHAENQDGGVYILRLESDTETQVRRLTLLK